MFAAPFELPTFSNVDDVVSRMGVVFPGEGLLPGGTIMNMRRVVNQYVLRLPVTVDDCNCILAQRSDASRVAAWGLVYIAGTFNAPALVWPAGLNQGAVANALRNWSILIRFAWLPPGQPPNVFSTF